MSKIKNIYCIGSSFTQGGGFEWGSNDDYRNYKLKKNYSHLDIPKEQYYFSYPGQLQKILKDNGYQITVENLGKSGYGNQYVYRTVFDLIFSKSFNKEESLLLLEMTERGRVESYFNDINDYVIFNYQPADKGIHPEHYSIAKNYHFDDEETIKTLESKIEIFKNFYMETILNEDVFKRIEQNCAMMFSLLEQQNIKYFTTSSGLVPPHVANKVGYTDDKKIFYTYENITDDRIIDFVSNSKLSIEDETNGDWEDFHAGYHGNGVIAENIFDKIKNLL